MLSSEVRTPAVPAPLHNLVDGGNIVESGDGKWENGVTFTQFGCYVITGDEATCDVDQEAVAPQECSPAVVFNPYILDLGVVYSAVDRGIDIKEIAIETMKIGASSRLEQLIWSGAGAGDTNPTLNDGTSLGAAASPRTSLGRMMDVFIDADADTGAQGTVHISPVTAAHLEGLVRPDTNGQLRTVFGGHKVIVGNYPSTFIAGHLGEIDLYLGEVYLNDAPDELRRVNDLLFQVQQLALAAWNPCAMFTQEVSYTSVG